MKKTVPGLENRETGAPARMNRVAWHDLNA